MDGTISVPEILRQIVEISGNALIEDSVHDPDPVKVRESIEEIQGLALNALTHLAGKGAMQEATQEF